MPIPGATLKSCTGQEEGSPEKYVTASAAVSGCRPPGERTRRADPARRPGTQAMFPPHVRAPAALSSAPSVSSSPSPPFSPLLPLLPRKGAVPCRTGAEHPAAYGNPKIVRAEDRSPGAVSGDIPAPSLLRGHRVRAPNMPLARPVADSPRPPILRKDTRTLWPIPRAHRFSAKTREPRGRFPAPTDSPQRHAHLARAENSASIRESKFKDDGEAGSPALRKMNSEEEKPCRRLTVN